LDLTDPGWQASVAAVREIHTWCRERDVSFLLILFRYEPDDLTDDVLIEFRRLADELHFELADARLWFQKHDNTNLQISVVDGHPNVEGHEILGQGITDLLVSRSLLGN